MAKSKPATVEPFLPPNRSLPDPLCRVVLVEPLIPENTGNISRTCVGTNTELHLVQPLGYELTESRVKRAGLDYWSHLALDLHPSFDAWTSQVRSHVQSAGTLDRVFFVETWGTSTLYDVQFQRGDWLVFGKETSGLDRDQVEALGLRPEQIVHLPMPGEIRSLNLSNAVAVSVFEVLRQLHGSAMHRL